ncbi:UBX domain-containing protein 4 isoform X2 [Nematolebias whitei]|uniref:UBX domain-containing protein 4 isoform X2 n=1 Tax=Nematolebias whitei TaxID=451745 RepID=UPI00189743B7|nr:UBX domain-containing protein 4 isoform X2 [Nematolebias whitei]
MFWFQGSIPDAISSAKRHSLIFAVVIAGEDEQSAQLMSSWEDERVSETAHRCCVAIKVDAKSDTCVQFSQIYPVVCIPSSFFIGDNGIPLEVVAGSVSPDELLKRINKVQQMHIQEHGGAGTVPEPCGPVESAPPAPVLASAREESVGSEAAASEPGTEPHMDKGSISSSVDDDKFSATRCASDQAAEAEGNLDSKVERFTKKLEEKREQRKKGEEENEITKEMERRKMGKNLQDLKKKQEEENNKRLLEERNREKAEEKAARERVRQQIAMDRADRAARYAQTQEGEKVAKQALLQSRQAEQEVHKEAVLRERSTVARIQFRLPDGTSFTNQFSPQSRLQEAWDFAAERVGNRYGHFALATMFPRREFTNEDLNQSLLDLELTPSSSVVLLPSSRPANSVVRSSGGGVWATLGTLLYPLLAVWRFLSSFFAAPTSSAETSRTPGQNFSSHTSSSSSSTTNKRDIPSKHTLENRPRDFKKDGKICRLRTQDDSEDDNNTWNGNSTQQM